MGYRADTSTSPSSDAGLGQYRDLIQSSSDRSRVIGQPGSLLYKDSRCEQANSHQIRPGQNYQRNPLVYSSRCRETLSAKVQTGFREVGTPIQAHRVLISDFHNHALGHGRRQTGLTPLEMEYQVGRHGCRVAVADHRQKLPGRDQLQGFRVQVGVG